MTEHVTNATAGHRDAHSTVGKLAQVFDAPASLPWRAGISTQYAFLAMMARIGWRNAALRRWYVASRLRGLTVGLEHRRRLSGVASLPRGVSLRVTMLCNARCKMCDHANSVDPGTQLPATYRRQMIELSVAKRLVDAISASRTMLSVTGGEPFLWGDNLFSLLDYCRERGVATSVTTNGTLLSGHIDDLVASPPDVLVVSVLGPGEVHDGIVGLPAHDSIRDALQRLYDIKGGDPWREPLVFTNTAMLRDNCHEFPEVVRLSREMGACGAHFQPVWLGTDEALAGDDAPACSPAGWPRVDLTGGAKMATEFWQGTQRARALSAQLGQAVSFTPPLTRTQMHTWYAEPERHIGPARVLCAHLLCQVLPDGSVSPCPGHTVGNLHEQEFGEVWNGARMREFRQRLMRVGAFADCARCCSSWQRS